MMNRSFLFGLGAGLIFSSLIVFGIQSLEPSTNSQPLPGEIVLSEDELNAKIEESFQKGIEEGKNEVKPSDSDPPVESKPEGIFIYISKGNSSMDVARLLLEAEIISDEDKFNSLIEAREEERNIKAGVYEIPIPSSEDEIIDLITK